MCVDKFQTIFESEKFIIYIHTHARTHAPTHPCTHVRCTHTHTQRCQVSRIGRESHAFEARLTLSRIKVQNSRINSGVGTRGAGGARAPLKFVKGGLSPLKWTCLYLFLVNTYLKVSLYILLAHALLYILTLQQLAMLVQRSGSRKGSTATCSVISWILINRLADHWSLWILMSPLTSNIFLRFWLRFKLTHWGSKLTHYWQWPTYLDLIARLYCSKAVEMHRCTLCNSLCKDEKLHLVGRVD